MFTVVWLFALLTLIAALVLMLKSHKISNKNLFNLVTMLAFFAATFIVFTLPYVTI